MPGVADAVSEGVEVGEGVAVGDSAAVGEAVTVSDGRDVGICCGTLAIAVGVDKAIGLRGDKAMKSNTPKTSMTPAIAIQ